MKTISEAMNWRYSTKDFDPNKKISTEDFEQLKDILHLQASSVNIQPWHYIIADDDAGKQRMTKGTQDIFEMNKNKLLDCSHVVLFATRVYADDAYLETILEQEDKDGRFAKEEYKTQMHQGRKMFLDIHRSLYTTKMLKVSKVVD
ncbi:nitroreductase family protein [Psychrobacter piechaudii]|uniref:Oxygen-insensitive NAD(P)H nitroreductase n=1 Tax=Psychrobacter piechaudii TaxID=1945521 RepID=A0A1R4GCT4_9GAMM|nr:nitroreductase family protein [Psychrobacter piechaudii]SJM66018.1 Oxygen-insensitive NAD(P)H nitroreductase [Psychrobacter piechaudii]